MQVSAAGVKFIESFESCKLLPYICPSGKPTIGYGHVIPWDVFNELHEHGISQARADELFAADLAKFTAVVQNKVRVPLKQPQIDALVSFAFNCGEKAFTDSTLLRKLNCRLFRACAEEFPRWVHDGRTDAKHPAGNVLPGLVRRRKAEQTMFLSSLGTQSPINTPQPPLKGSK